jgi:DNA-binding MarR family transcriptional regulator
VLVDDSDRELGVGLLLFIPYRSLETRVFAALAEAGFDDITPAQGRVMQRVGPDGTRLTELAEASLVTTQTASALVDQLERSGYVERRPDARDARARLVCIAPRGDAARGVAQAAVSAVEDEWRTHLGQRRWAHLRDALAQLRTITDPYL